MHTTAKSREYTILPPPENLLRQKSIRKSMPSRNPAAKLSPPSRPQSIFPYEKRLFPYFHSPYTHLKYKEYKYISINLTAAIKNNAIKCNLYTFHSGLLSIPSSGFFSIFILFKTFSFGIGFRNKKILLIY